MPTLYKYICYSCRDSEIRISDDDSDEEYGVISAFRNMADRDVEFLCPNCERPITRAVIPDNFTTWWGNPYNSKKTCLGPTQNLYPPTLAKQRRERNPSTHFGWRPGADKPPKPGVT